MLAITPLLSVLTAYLLRQVWMRPHWRGLIVASLVGTSLVALVVIGLYVGSDQPLAAITGRQSRDAYLRQNVAYGASHRALSDLLPQLDPRDRVLFVLESQVYYLPPDLVERRVLLPDHLNVSLPLLTETHADPQAMLAALRDDGITYILLNEANIRFWLQSDTSGQLGRSKAAFDQLAPLLEPVYRDGAADRPSIVIYRIPPR